MIVSIHQPNFLPWLGFFHKMAAVDIFILLDNVPFTKNGYQNRVKIKTAQGERWLTVPVLTKGRFGQLTRDVPINPCVRWEHTHLATLRTNYRRAPFFGDVMRWLEPLYAHPPDRLAPFNRRLIEGVLDYVGLPVQMVSASSLGVEGKGGELLLKLVQAVGGTVYLSGPSGRHYLDPSLFHRAGVRLEFHQFVHPRYPQLYGDFIPNLSILDLLMNVGPVRAMDYLRRQEMAPQPAFAVEVSV